MSRILNNTKALIFIIAILLIANLAILVFFLKAKHPPFRDERGGDRDKPALTEFLKKEIQFNPQQLQQYDSLKKIHWKTARPLFKGVNAAKDSFYIHIKDSVIIDQVLWTAADSIANKQRQMDLMMFAHFRNIRNICTNEQKPLYDSLVQDMIRKIINPYKRDNYQKKPGYDRERRPDDSAHERR